MHLSPTVANIVEPATLLMARRSRELRAQGRDIIDLSLGEPDHDPPAFALEPHTKPYAALGTSTRP
jgi:aspartate aminotransferase